MFRGLYPAVEPPHTISSGSKGHILKLLLIICVVKTSNFCTVRWSVCVLAPVEISNPPELRRDCFAGSCGSVVGSVVQCSGVLGGLGPTSECVKPSLDKMPSPKLPSIHPAHITHGLSQLSMGEGRIHPAKSLVRNRARVSITDFDIHFNLLQ